MTKTDTQQPPALSNEAISFADKLFAEKSQEEALSFLTIALTYAVVKTSQSPVHAFLGADIASKGILEGVTKLYQPFKARIKAND